MGGSQVKHMRIWYHSLGDLLVTRHARETESEKRFRNTQNKPCRVELQWNLSNTDTEGTERSVRIREVSV